MAQHPLLAVRGEAVLEVDPEIARIEVSVAATDSDREKTLQLLAEHVAAVDKVLASLADITERADSSGVRINPQLTSRATRDRGSGYHGAVYYSVTVTGFDRLGELMAQLGEVEQAEVGGPWWQLRPGSPVYGQARVAAVLDAVRRARDYAAALGSEPDGLVELADDRLLSDSRGQTETAANPSARLPHRVRAAVPEEISIDLAPVKQVARATVEARFTIAAPDLTTVDAAR